MYSARRTRGADQFEVVLVPRCREAKATKYYHEDMPWLSMVHEADDKAGMKAHTTSLMAKFGITSIPALVLLDKRGGMICADARDKCVADPEGWAFPWRKQSQPPATARTAGQGPVVNFDLPPRARLQPEPTCARPLSFAKGSTAITTVTEAAAPPAHGGNETREQARRGKRKSLSSEEVMGPPPDGGQPPHFTLAAARDRAPPPRAPAAPADIEHNIHHPPADIHSRA